MNSLYLIIAYLFLCACRPVSAGALPVPTGIMPALFKQALFPGNPLTFMTQAYDNTFDNEHKERESPAFGKLPNIDFDDLDLFDDDQEEKEEEKNIALQWNETRQEYHPTLVIIPVIDLLEKRKEAVDDNLLSELQSALGEPDRNATYTIFLPASFKEHGYLSAKKERGGLSDEGESSDEDEPGDKGETREETTSQDSQESPEQQSEGAGAGQAGYSLTPLQLEEVIPEHQYLIIKRIITVQNIEMTEEGAARLQYYNPHLFETKEEAGAAFKALKQEGLDRSQHTLEYQALADLFLKYQRNPLINVFFRKNNQALLNLDYFYSSRSHSIYIQKSIVRSQLKPLEITNEKEPILVICSSVADVGRLTKEGAQRLQERNPELFKSADIASIFFKVLQRAGGLMAEEHIMTQQYQAAARFIEHCFNKGDLNFMIFEGKHPDLHYSSVTVETIPYGMIKHRKLSFDKKGDGFCVSKTSRLEYVFFSAICAVKEMLHDQTRSSDYKAQTMQLLIPDNQQELNVEAFAENVNWLIGDFFQQAKSSFAQGADEQNKSLP